MFGDTLKTQTRVEEKKKSLSRTGIWAIKYFGVEMTVDFYFFFFTWN